MTSKEKYHMMQDYISYQETQWSIHRHNIGFIGRIMENIFGSDFAKAQRVQFEKFCKRLENE